MCFDSILEIYFTLIFLTSRGRRRDLVGKSLRISRNNMYPALSLSRLSDSLFLKSKGIRLVYSHPVSDTLPLCNGEGPGMGLKYQFYLLIYC